MADMVTIRDAVKRAKAEGVPVTEYALRSWVSAGIIPVCKIGKKAILYYPNLERYLKCEDGAGNKPAAVAAVGGIRRLDV